MLYPPLVTRIYNEENKNEKNTKTRLHQMFGAYVQGNAHKKAALLLDELAAGADMLDGSKKILSLHASTAERLPQMRLFCDFITHHTGAIGSIIDLGCGFSPFALPYWRQNIHVYHAYDIDTRTTGLLNRFFTINNLPPTASCADIITETPAHKTDLALLCKLIPVLEAQVPGRGFELARNMDTRFLAITYPLKSLGGRNKGMGKNYAAQFSQAYEAGQLGCFTLVQTAEIGSELVFLLHNSEST